MKTKNDWCFRFFNSPDYLDIYRDMTGPERTQRELEFCERVLHWKPGESILDAPCGAGRHSLELAKCGHTVVGLDVSSFLLGQARTSLNFISLHAPAPLFVRGLLQSMPFRSASFHFGICLFSSFGYGESEEDNVTVLREFARVLHPGGKVVIDVMNRHFIVPRLNRIHESIQSGLRVREERSIIENGRRLRNRILVKDQMGNQRTYLYCPWLFNGWELSWLAARAGLVVESVYGDFGGSKYETESERAMLVAVKS